MSTPTQRKANERHQAKLDDIRQQIDDGTLVVRKMTAAERKRWGGPRPTAASKRKRGRRRG
jgi:hypothetical protein